MTAATAQDLQQEQISYWLGLWHAWSRSSDRCARGYNSVSAGFGGYRARGRWGGDCGDMDAAADAALCRAIEQAVQAVPDPWRTALHVEARNIDAPARVWRSARLDHIDIKRCTNEARLMLWAQMDRMSLV